MTDNDEPGWVQAMRDELAEMTHLERITCTAAWTTLMTNKLLGELGDVRRQSVVRLLEERGGAKEIPWLADTLGTRVNVIQRLWEEGNKRARKGASTDPSQ